MKIPALFLTLGLISAPSAESQEPLAIDVLEEITIAEDASMDGYDRSAFAPSEWVDANGSGCTTREDILARDLDDDTLSIDGCTVEYGQTIGAYSGELIEHVQGESQVDIEHVVAVGQAWRNGAHAWDEETKQAFYQDEENLIAVSASENRSKSHKDASEYLPTNQGAYCSFAAAKVYVKAKYDLAMNSDEHAVINDILTDSECVDTPAAPAQAMYTSDWDSAPSGNSPLEEIDTRTMAILGGVALLLIIAVVLFSSRSSRSRSRSGRTQVRRAAMRGIRRSLNSNQKR